MSMYKAERESLTRKRRKQKYLLEALQYLLASMLLKMPADNKVNLIIKLE